LCLDPLRDMWRGLAVGAVNGMKQEELLAIAKMAARVWPRQPYSDIAKFLRRFPPARIEGTQGFVDFEKELTDRLGLPPVEQVVVEGPGLSRRSESSLLENDCLRR
jgi:hypothetical protein